MQSLVHCEDTLDAERRIFNSPTLRGMCEMKSWNVAMVLFCAQLSYGEGLVRPITKMISVPDPVPRSAKNDPPGPSPQFPTENTSVFPRRIAAPGVPLTQLIFESDLREKDSDPGSVQQVGHWEDSEKLAGLPGQAARDLLVQALTRRLTMPDPGVSPLTLAQCLRKSDHPDRREIVVTYWDLSLKLLLEQFALDELERVSDTKVFRDTAGAVELEVLQSEAVTRKNQASVELLQSQHRLAGLLGGPRQQDGRPPLPLPLDLPIVGPYQTNFDRMFQNQTPSRRLVEINEMLQPMQKVIESRVHSLRAAERLFYKIQHEAGHGEVDIAVLVNACSGWHRQKENFVANIMEYNRIIVEYAFAVAPQRISDIQIVRMLVPQRPEWSQLATRRIDNVGAAVYEQGLGPVSKRGLRKVPPGMEIDLQPVPVE